MDYPEWAPQILVGRHKKRTDSNLPNGKVNPHDPEVIIADVMQKHGDKITEENIEDIRRNLYRKSIFGLPDKESTALLEQLITDLRMKDVWKALAKRIENDREFLEFFSVCEGGITGWRGDPKQTSSERRVFFQDIWDTTAKLQTLMSKAGEFDFYSVNKLLDDKHVEWLLEVLDAPNDVSYARFCLDEVIPSMFEVLNDIAAKAKQYGEEELSVKKPNSPNAEIHYFTRLLSDYFQRRYNQPLHEVVAITTSVIFNQQNIDGDYVRKIVKR
jgi:hypothetical protein